MTHSQRNQALRPEDQSAKMIDRMFDDLPGYPYKDQIDSLRDRPNDSPPRAAIGRLKLDFDDDVGDRPIEGSKDSKAVEDAWKPPQGSDRFSTPKTLSKNSNYNSKPPDSSSPAPLMSPTDIDKLMAPPSPAPETQRPYLVMNADHLSKNPEL